MHRLRIAVAGAGLIGRVHAQTIGAHEACELAGIADPDEAARPVAQRFGVSLHASLADLLTQTRPDGVILATPNRLHVAQAIECLEAGVPVLVEKPVAHTLAEGERLCRLAGTRGVPVLVGHHRAHSPAMSVARTAVRDGALGELVAVSGSALFYKPDAYFDASPWRREPGGGPILINLIHDIGNLRALCGEITEVQAAASSARRRFPVEDTVAITLRFERGALGTFLLSDTAASARSWEQTSGENPSYPSYPEEDCYHLTGTEGALSIPSMRLNRFARGQERSWWTPYEWSVLETPREDPLVCQLRHFCAVIRGEARPLVSARDGLANLRVTEAIAEAARTGRAVRVA